MSTSTKILMRLERHIRNPPVVRQHGSTSQTQQQGTDYPSQTIVSSMYLWYFSWIYHFNVINGKPSCWILSITSDFQFRHIFYIFPEHYNPHSATRLSEDSQLPLWNASQSQPDFSFEARGQLVHPPASMDFEAASHQAYSNVLGFTNAFQYNSNLFPYQQLSPFENNRPTYL